MPERARRVPAREEREVAEDWRLRDEHGEHRTLTTQQLRDGLAEGTIPSSVMVARGSKEFQPAFSVPELATAAIRAKRTPSIPPAGAPAAPGLRPAPPKAGPRPPRVATPDVPPPPRSRRRIAHTLVGIQGDEETGAPPSEAAPIVAPGSGAAGARRAITQAPRFTPPPAAAAEEEGSVVIPRAPRAPAASSLPAWDGSEVRGAPSIFDGEEDAQTLVQKDEAAKKPPARPPGPPPKRGTAPSQHPPPLPRRDGTSPPKAPVRQTVMGLGTGGDRGAPRLVPPKAASTPPPPLAKPASTSTPPPAPARPATTSTPPPGPAAAGARPASRPPPGPPPRRKTPAPPGVVAATPSPPSAAPQPAEAGGATTTEPAGSDGGVLGTEPQAAAPPAHEGTPTVPMPEAQPAQKAPGGPDDDEAPTSKMHVQVVHGAALAMKAALAAPHFDAPKPTPEAPPAAAAEPAEPPASLPPVAPQVSSSPPRLPSSEPPLALPPAASKPPLGPSGPPAASISEPAPADDEEPAPHSGVEVPVSSLFAASAVWIVGLVSVFFVGRCSALDARPDGARRGVATAARFAILSTLPKGDVGAPKPCWVTRQPARWAEEASRSIPFDMVAMPGGGAMLVGYGLSEEKGLGLRVDPRTGKFERIHEETVEAGIARITPLPGKTAEDAPRFFASPRGDSTLVPVPGVDPPLFIRFGKGEIAALEAPDGAASPLFTLEGDDRPNTEQIVPAGPKGFYASFRRGEGVFGAWVSPARKAAGEVRPVAGSGGKVGKPRAGWNGKDIAVVFADRASEGAPWQVRIGVAPGGDVPTSTEAFAIPPGGPGGDAIAPDVVGLPDGRWLVMWTEGSSGRRAIRSLTMGPDRAPLGDPIALSPPAGNFGQAQLAVVGGYVTVLFLQDGDAGYELWGAVLSCG